MHLINYVCHGNQHTSAFLINQRETEEGNDLNEPKLNTINSKEARTGQNAPNNFGRTYIIAEKSPR